VSRADDAAALAVEDAGAAAGWRAAEGSAGARVPAVAAMTGVLAETLVGLSGAALR
jgi:hypothetical protein